VGWTRSRRRGQDAEGVEGDEEWDGFPPPNRLPDLEEHRELPERGPGRNPSQKLISVVFKRHSMPVVEMFVVNGCRVRKRL